MNGDPAEAQTRDLSNESSRLYLSASLLVEMPDHLSHNARKLVFRDRVSDQVPQINQSVQSQKEARSVKFRI